MLYLPCNHDGILVTKFNFSATWKELEIYEQTLSNKDFPDKPKSTAMEEDVQDSVLWLYACKQFSEKQNSSAWYEINFRVFCLIITL